MDGRFSDAGSRWGIKGSTEVSEGLTAVYKFETRVNTSSKDPNQSTKQMYAGLSGGFGSLTLGKFHNAAQNHSGGIRDIGYWYSSGDAPTNTGNTVSYAFSSDAASFQLDAIMDGGIDTGKSIDQVQFGMSVNLGDIGKVALGYVEVEDTVMPAGMADPVDMPGMMDDDPMDDPMDDPAPSTEKMPLKNSATLIIGTSATDPKRVRQAGTLDRYVHTLTDGDSVKTAYLVEVPAASTYYDVTATVKSFDDVTTTNLNSVSTTWDPADEGKSLEESKTVMVTRQEVTEDHLIAGGLVKADRIVLITRVMTATDGTKTTNRIVEASTASNYYRTNADGTELLLADGTGPSTAAAGTDAKFEEAIKGEGIQFMALYAESEEPTEMPEEETPPEMAEETPEETPEMAQVEDPEDFGYTSTHVSVQLNLGAVTLGLGYSEKESNAKGSMDEKTTYVGASGSIGDTGMGWRAWTRDVSNSGNTKGDANPWGIGINKDLGGGAFTFVEHHNADNDKSGNTIIALGVNF